MNDPLAPIGPQVASARNISAHVEQMRAFDARREIMEALQVYVSGGNLKPRAVMLDVQRFTAAEQVATRTQDGTLMLLGLRLVQDDGAEGGLTFA